MVGARRGRLRRALGPGAAKAASRSGRRRPRRRDHRLLDPLAADYTRFARDRSSALWGTGVGYFVASLWLWCSAPSSFFSRELTDPAALPAAVAAGGVGAALALLAVTVDETDEAFANAYSAAVSIQNLAPELPQRALVIGVVDVATIGALTIDLLSYQTFLLMLGSFFVQLFGVLLADWLVAGARYREREMFGGPAVRLGMVGAWIAGFAVYQWLLPDRPASWTDRLGIGPTSVSARPCRASSSPSCSGSRSRRWGSDASRALRRRRPL